MDRDGANRDGPSVIERAAARLRKAAPALAPAPFDHAPLQPSAPQPGPSMDTGAAQGRFVNVDRGALMRAGIIMPGAHRSRTAEEFRLVKHHVLRNALREPNVELGERNGRLIMITSARPREGKTFTAAHLALSIASERDLKVLLIDADVHRHSVMTVFGLTSEVGWVDLLENDSLTFSDVLIRTNIPNLAIMPPGPSRPEVPELLSSKKMAALVAEMAQRYPDRFILFDAPPCLASSDPAILAAHMGQVVFVVEAHRTQREEVESALRLISSCSNISLVLNKTENFLAEDFGAYSDYYAAGA